MQKAQNGEKSVHRVVCLIMNMPFGLLSICAAGDLAADVKPIKIFIDDGLAVEHCDYEM